MDMNNFHRILLKIAYWLVAISIVVLIGLTFYTNHYIKKNSGNEKGINFESAPVEKAEDSNSKVNIGGMSVTIESKSDKK